MCEICHRTPLIQLHISPSDTTQRCSRCCCKLCMPNSKTQANPKTGRLPLLGVAHASNKVTMLRWLWARLCVNSSVGNRLQSSGSLAMKCFAAKIDGLAVGTMSFFSARYALLSSAAQFLYLVVLLLEHISVCAARQFCYPLRLLKLCQTIGGPRDWWAAGARQPARRHWATRTHPRSMLGPPLQTSACRAEPRERIR